MRNLQNFDTAILYVCIMNLSSKPVKYTVYQSFIDLKPYAKVDRSLRIIALREGVDIFEAMRANFAIHHLLTLGYSLIYPYLKNHQ